METVIGLPKLWISFSHFVKSKKKNLIHSFSYIFLMDKEKMRKKFNVEEFTTLADRLNSYR